MEQQRRQSQKIDHSAGLRTWWVKMIDMHFFSKFKMFLAQEAILGQAQHIMGKHREGNATSG